jgi:hypothetical protein
MSWITIKELSKILNVSEKTIRRRIKSGEFETKTEHTPGGGKDTILILSQLDKSTTGQLDKNNFTTGQLDKSTTGQLDKNNFTTGQLDKSTTGQLDKLNKSIEIKEDNTIGQLDKQLDTCKSDFSDGQIGQVGQNNKETRSIASVRDNKKVGFGESSHIDKSAETPNGVQVENLPATVADDFLATENTERLPQLKLRNDMITKEQKDFEKRSLEDREKAWARFRIVEEYRKFKLYCKVNNVKLTAGNRSFEIKVNNREILVQEMHQLGLVSISCKTVSRWDKTHRDSGNIEYPVSLCENRKGNAGRGQILEKPLKNRIKIMAIDYRSLKATEIYRILEDELRSVGQDMPVALRTLADIVTKTRKDQLAMAVGKGKKAYKDRIRPHVHRVNNALPGEIWESDGHNMNNLILSPFYDHDRPALRFLVRPVAMVWYDVATGLIAGHCLCVAENSNVVRTSLKYAILRYGKPVKIRIDNGSGYKNVEHCPHIFAGQKRNTSAKQKAMKMISENNNGLYKNLGLEYQFTIPGNAESKSIEPFWNFCVSQFEKAFPVWIGNKIEERPEELKLTNKILIKKHGEHIPTWEAYNALFDKYVEIWNNRTRPVLRNANGEEMSPIEAYMQIEHTAPGESELNRIIRDPYFQLATINRGEIKVNGIWYSHPVFMSLNGAKMGYYYDEKQLDELTVCYENGQIFHETAKIVLPGLQVGDDMSALQDTRRRERQGKLCYLALQGTDDADRYHKALEISTENLIDDQSRLQEIQKSDGNQQVKLLESKKTPERKAVEEKKTMSIDEQVAAFSSPAPEKTDDDDEPGMDPELKKELAEWIRLSYGG